MLTWLLLLAALRFVPTPEPGVYIDGTAVMFTSWPAQVESGVYLEDEFPR
jgi:hypothetical protein